MTTGIPIQTIQKLCEGLTIQSILQYDNPQALHLFLANETTTVGILTITWLEEGLHIDVVGDPPHRPDRDPFSPYEQGLTPTEVSKVSDGEYFYDVSEDTPQSRS